MKIREMIAVVLGEVGDQSSIEHVRKRVSELYGKKPSYSFTYKQRHVWRRDIAGGLTTDARKHEDIPRRNMLNDKLVTASHIKCIFRFFNDKKINPGDILELIDSKDAKFHSLEQLTTAIKDLQELQIEFKK